MKTKRKPNTERETRSAVSATAGYLNFHRSPDEAIPCLLNCEGWRLRQFREVREMACGDGALVLPLRLGGFAVSAADIVDRGCPGQAVADYLACAPVHEPGVAGVTNPPFNYAEPFIIKACAEFDYVAMILRLRYLAAKHLLDEEGRPTRARLGSSPIWANTRIPFARVIIPDGRWPMMHRADYEGPRTDSGPTDFAWFVWDAGHRGSPQIIMEAQLNAASAAGRSPNASV